MIRGQTRNIRHENEVSKIDITVNSKIHNKFIIEVVDSATGEVRQKAKAENIILNQMWVNMTKKWSNFIHFGSGTSTPNATDTSMTSFVSAKECIGAPTELNDHLTYSITRKIRIGEDEYVGINISEVGLGYSNSGTSLCTKALITDMNGNSISINKTETDIINIYATVFLNYENAQKNGIYLYAGSTNIANQYDLVSQNICGYSDSGSGGFPNQFSLASAPNVGNPLSNKTFTPVWEPSTKTISASVRFSADEGNGSKLSRCGCVLTSYHSGSTSRYGRPFYFFS